MWLCSCIRRREIKQIRKKTNIEERRITPHNHFPLSLSPAEGKALAQSRDVKFIETSSGIQHNVDELLVGVLKQVRLKETRDKKAANSASKMKSSRTHISLHMAKDLLQKICLNDISKSKSCENLHVL